MGIVVYAYKMPLHLKKGAFVSHLILEASVTIALANLESGGILLNWDGDDELVN